MVVASTGVSAIIWNCVLPPQTLSGQVNPVVVSAPTMPCQAPVPKKLLKGLRAVKPSKPELKSSVAEPGVAAAGAGTGERVGAGAGTGEEVGVGAGAGARAGGVVTAAADLG